MSAFPDSGRSKAPKWAESKVRFRPKAATSERQVLTFACHLYRMTLLLASCRVYAHIEEI